MKRPTGETPLTAEAQRIRENSAGRTRGAWTKFGPYLAEREWGTVREDYSADGACWNYFPHDHARSRAYRWSEDGLLGLCDDEGRLCFSLALWNGQDPILKERLFGLAPEEGTHGESVKETYFYLDSTPTHSYMRALYRYPLRAFPYNALLGFKAGQETGRRIGPEKRVEDTGIFDGNRFVDVTVEYAKATPEDIRIRVAIQNRSNEAAHVTLIPQLVFRNTWSWSHEGQGRKKPNIRAVQPGVFDLTDETLDRYRFELLTRTPVTHLFTENETNTARMWGFEQSAGPFKDAFHDFLVRGRREAVNAAETGTKAGLAIPISLEPQASTLVDFRLASREEQGTKPPGGIDVVHARRDEAREYWRAFGSPSWSEDEHTLLARAFATQLWSKQYYNLSVATWLDGDSAQPGPPQTRLRGRNHDWRNVDAHDVLLVPDKWEYPWFAAWDLAFQAVGVARVDPALAKCQLETLLSARYQRDDGVVPAYEFAFTDQNPPILAWACLKVAAADGSGAADLDFLARVFDPLKRSFNAWLRTAQSDGLFAPGFLGLDNSGVFDRGAPPPMSGSLRQADGSGWATFFAASIAQLADSLAVVDPQRFARERATFMQAHADLTRRQALLFDERDGFFFDHVANANGALDPIRCFSASGFVPLLGATSLRAHGERLDLSPVSATQFRQILRRMLDPNEFLSPFGVRSASRAHRDSPAVFIDAEGGEHRFSYAQAESETWFFGANSNWRGPVWLPLNYLLIDALEKYAEILGESFRVEFPIGGGKECSLRDVAVGLRERLLSLFLKNEEGTRPCNGNSHTTTDSGEELFSMSEYFCGDTGRGCGARHQGWTGLIAEILLGLPRK